MQQVKGKEWLLLLACFALGGLAEMSFLHGEIGISYLVFIAGFYLVFFLIFKLSFNHRRIGLLFMVSIWVLSGSYLLYDNGLFYTLNLFVIPLLVLSHIVLITSPNTFQWDTPFFMTGLMNKIHLGNRYSLSFCKRAIQGIFRNMDEQKAYILKRVLVGLGICIPLLTIVIRLLMSADVIFEEFILHLPLLIFDIMPLESFPRLIFIIFVGFLLFGLFQVLQDQGNLAGEVNKQLQQTVRWDSIIAITILAFINVVYLLFVVIQFKYFFSNVLMDGLTYAEYARRGFTELVFVMLINWIILMSFLKFVQDDRRGIRLTINVLYTLLIIVSGFILASAYQRLSMYEAAYGFTMLRLLVHALMIYLAIIFAYTLIRVWINQLSVTHFYLIMGLIFYTILNVMNVEQVIVDQNIKRYEQTGKIDIHYLNSLSYTGWDGLIHLFELGENDPVLKEVLVENKNKIRSRSINSWQSFNFSKQKVTKRLNQLVIKEDAK